MERQAFMVQVCHLANVNLDRYEEWRDQYSDIAFDMLVKRLYEEDVLQLCGLTRKKSR